MEEITPDLIEWMATDDVVASKWKDIGRDIGLHAYIEKETGLEKVSLHHHHQRTNSDRLKDMFKAWAVYRRDSFNIHSLLTVLENQELKDMYEWVKLMTGQTLNKTQIENLILRKDEQNTRKFGTHKTFRRPRPLSQHLDLQSSNREPLELFRPRSCISLCSDNGGLRAPGLLRSAAATVSRPSKENTPERRLAAKNVKFRENRPTNRENRPTNRPPTSRTACSMSHALKPKRHSSFISSEHKDFSDLTEIIQKLEEINNNDYPMKRTESMNADLYKNNSMTEKHHRSKFPKTPHNLKAMDNVVDEERKRLITPDLIQSSFSSYPARKTNTANHTIFGSGHCNKSKSAIYLNENPSKSTVNTARPIQHLDYAEEMILVSSRFPKCHSKSKSALSQTDWLNEKEQFRTKTGNNRTLPNQRTEPENYEKKMTTRDYHRSNKARSIQDADHVNTKNSNIQTQFGLRTTNGIKASQTSGLRGKNDIRMENYFDNLIKLLETVSNSL